MIIEKVKLFGPRVLVEHVVPSEKGRIIIPDASGTKDQHRLARVLVVGDGRTGDKTEEMMSKVGDIIVFQTNDVMANTQKFKADGKVLLYLLESDIIAYASSDEISYEALTMAGEYVLVEPVLDRGDSKLVLPESVSKAFDFVYFKVLKTGSRVTVPVVPGQEVVLNLGRINPMFVTSFGHTQREVGYIHQSYIHGVVE